MVGHRVGETFAGREDVQVRRLNVLDTEKITVVGWTIVVVTGCVLCTVMVLIP